MELFSNEWRAERVRRGDIALKEATEYLTDFNARKQGDTLDTDFVLEIELVVSSLLKIAEIHYLAANVRGKLTHDS